MSYRWITKNGRRIQIPTRRYVREIDSQQESNVSYAQPTFTHKFYKPEEIQRQASKLEKKWYEEGWRKEIYKFSDDYAVDLGNFGNYNFSFVVRKNDKEIFTIPKKLIKNAISLGFETMVLPGCPVDAPIKAIEYAIDLYDQLTS